MKGFMKSGKYLLVVLGVIVTGMLTPHTAIAETDETLTSTSQSSLDVFDLSESLKTKNSLSTKDTQKDEVSKDQPTTNLSKPSDTLKSNIASPKKIITGVWGTAPWEFDEETGILEIGSGTLGTNDPTSFPGDDQTKAPWQDALLTSAAINRLKLKEIRLPANGDINFPVDSRNLFTFIKGISSHPGTVDGLDNLVKISNLKNARTESVEKMDYMFAYNPKLETLEGIKDWDTSNVKKMEFAFANLSELKELDLSNWNTKNVKSVYSIFKDTSNLKKIDVTSWDLNKALPSSGISSVFLGCGVQELSVGPDFYFRGENVTVYSFLPDIPVRENGYYTGKWRNVGSGTVKNPKGEYKLTSKELMKNYDGATMADTYVWEVNQVWGTSPWEFDEKTGILEIGPGTLGTNNHDVSQDYWNNQVMAPWQDGNKESAPVDKDKVKEIHFPMNGEVYFPANSANLFTFRKGRSSHPGTVDGLDNLVKISNLKNARTESVVNMDFMFANNKRLETLEGMENWNTDNLNSALAMFTEMEQLKELNLSNWNIGKLELCNMMFSDNKNLRKIDLTGWDMTNLLSTNGNFVGMFYNSGIQQISVGPKFNFISVNGYTAMLKKIPVGENGYYTGKWRNVGSGTVKHPKGKTKLTSEELMKNYDGATMADTYVWEVNQVWGTSPWDFDEATGTITFEPGELTSDDIGNSNSVKYAPWSEGKRADGSVIPAKVEPNEVNKIILPNEEKKLIFPENSSSLFGGVADKINAIPNLSDIENIDKVDTAKVKNMSYLFSHLEKIKKMDLSKWSTSIVDTMEGMFLGSNFETLGDISNWQTNAVTNTQDTFAAMPNIHSINLANWNVKNVTKMGRMFAAGSSTKLEKINLSGDGWEATPTSDYAGLFTNQRLLKELSLNKKFNQMNGTLLEEPSTSKPYTGRWVSVGTGTALYPRKDIIYDSSKQFMEDFSINPVSDTFVWEEIDKIYKDRLSMPFVPSKFDFGTQFPYVTDHEYSLKSINNEQRLIINEDRATANPDFGKKWSLTAKLDPIETKGSVTLGGAKLQFTLQPLQSYNIGDKLTEDGDIIPASPLNNGVLSDYEKDKSPAYIVYGEKKAASNQPYNVTLPATSLEVPIMSQETRRSTPDYRQEGFSTKLINQRLSVPRIEKRMFEQEFSSQVTWTLARDIE